MLSLRAQPPTPRPRRPHPARQNEPSPRNKKENNVFDGFEPFNAESAMAEAGRSCMASAVNPLHLYGGKQAATAFKKRCTSVAKPVTAAVVTRFWSLKAPKVTGANRRWLPELQHDQFQGSILGCTGCLQLFSAGHILALGRVARQLDIARAGERQVNLFALTNKGISMLIRQNATQVIIKDGAGYIPRPFRSVCWVDHGTCIWTVAYTVSCMHDRSTEGGLFIPGN